MKWPLAPAVLCLAGGIVTGDVFRVHWALPLILLAGLTSAAVGKKHARLLALGTLLFTGGWANLLWHTEMSSVQDLRVLLTDDPKIVTLEGTLAEAPRERLVKTKRGVVMHFSCLIQAQRIRLENEWRPAIGTVWVQAPMAPPAGLQRARSIQVTGSIHPPESATGPGGFDFQEYLARQGVYFELQTSKPDDWHLPETETEPPWPQRFRVWATRQIQGTLPAGDGNVMLLQAMSLGWKAGLTDDIKEPFIHSGTMHIFAISGLHVALIALMMVELLRGATIPRRTCAYILIPLLWFYTATTGWPASAMRSAIMMTVIGAGWILERPSNLLNSLAAAALIILLLDPQQLFQAGFQLSFMVVLSMGLLFPPIEAWRQKLFQPDPLLPEQLRPRWQRWLDWPIRFVTMSAVTSVAAWLGSLPLIAHYFHLVTPVSLLANLVLVPLGSLALMSSFASMLLAWCPPIADLYSHAAWILMEGMVRSSKWFADRPGAWWPMAEPGRGIFISYYVCLLTAFASEWKSVWRWRVAGTAGLALACLLGASWQQHREGIRLTVLDVHGGDAHVFEGGGYLTPLVVDAGSETAFAAVLQPYLQSRGIREVPQLLLTHGDAWHVGGAPALIEHYGVPRLITSPVKSRSPGYLRLVRDWSTNGSGHLVVTNGSTVGPWAILHPAATDKFPAGDDNAIVLYGEIRGVGVLLLSDLGREGQKALLERHPGLRAEVIVTGIPSKGEPVTEELLAVVRPQVVIVTCAIQPAMEQAGKELRQRLGQGTWQTIYVSDQGSVTLDFRTEGCFIQPMRGGGRTIIRTRRR